MKGDRQTTLWGEVFNCITFFGGQTTAQFLSTGDGHTSLLEVWILQISCYHYVQHNFSPSCVCLHFYMLHAIEPHWRSKHYGVCQYFLSFCFFFIIILYFILLFVNTSESGQRQNVKLKWTYLSPSYYSAKLHISLRWKICEKMKFWDLLWIRSQFFLCNKIWVLEFEKQVLNCHNYISMHLLLQSLKLFEENFHKNERCKYLP